MIEQLSTLPAWVPAILKLAGILSVLVWLRVRSGSDHVLRSRVWSLVQGRPQAGDPVIQGFLAQRSTLMQFRVVTGVRVPTVVHTHRLLAWLDEHEEEVGEVARCGDHFDVRLPGLVPRLPSKAWLVFVTLVFLACAGITMLAGLTMLSDRGLVSVRGGSGAMIWLATSDASRWGSFEHFGPADCDQRAPTAIGARVGLPANEVATVCRWFTDRNVPRQIRATVRQQRTALLIIIALALGYGVPAFSASTTARAARAMRARLDRRRASSSAPMEEQRTLEPAGVSTGVSVEVGVTGS
ncbi:DUF6216 family protein [Frateuria terrea]|uniref:Uncharacterized protein n=1 Tax=Frateuria terrea TaxID=529704 RepID=A0A1H6UEJ3_9GAMM|nr:DUF6216 family protein [Frateuria terrea]SEI89094.1 hypothetical protein SAMN04487997_1945 [Frateuria terrea]SFP37329.1 hypothetical protein SAMN02927913_1779 [Frateuria terrea]